MAVADPEHIFGCRSFAMLDDETVRRDVIEELEWEPRVTAGKIGVAVHNGIVTLSGHVESCAEKIAAERAAWRVKGVRALAQEIEVHPSTEKKMADDEIAERALKLLKWDAAVPEDRITLRVEHGIVTLQGEVEWQYQRDEAEHDIHRLGGVKGVVNAITVKPRVNAEDVQDQIEKAFARSAELEAARISVSAESGRIVLTGKVNSWIERELAERAAWSAPGVVEVVDEIEVVRP
jgi:osmotically-inducible protein OsmY